jgi:hypothetical protein
MRGCAAISKDLMSNITERRRKASLNRNNYNE